MPSHTAIPFSIVPDQEISGFIVTEIGWQQISTRSENEWELELTLRRVGISPASLHTDMVRSQIMRELHSLLDRGWELTGSGGWEVRQIEEAPPHLPTAIEPGPFEYLRNRSVELMVRLAVTRVRTIRDNVERSIDVSASRSEIRGVLRTFAGFEVLAVTTNEPQEQENERGLRIRVRAVDPSPNPIQFEIDFETALRESNGLRVASSMRWQPFPSTSRRGGGSEITFDVAPLMSTGDRLAAAGDEAERLGQRILAERLAGRGRPTHTEDAESYALRQAFSSVQREQEGADRRAERERRRALLQREARRREIEHTMPGIVAERLAEVAVNLRGGWDEIRQAIVENRIEMPPPHPFSRCIIDDHDIELRGDDLSMRIAIDSRFERAFEGARGRLLEIENLRRRRVLGVPRACGTRVRGGVYWTLLPRLTSTRMTAEDRLVQSLSGRGDPIDPKLPIERYIFDPPRRISLREFGISAIGVNTIERDGVVHLIDVIGSRYYPNVCDFLEEARMLGVSRRLPLNSVPWDRITSESRLICVHANGYIDSDDLNTPAWRRRRNANIAECPRSVHDEPSRAEHCAVFWWHDIIGGTMIDGTPEDVRRHLPWGSYEGHASPMPHAKRYPAIIASFPLDRLHVIDDPYDGSHNTALERIVPQIENSTTLVEVVDR